LCKCEEAESPLKDRKLFEELLSPKNPESRKKTMEMNVEIRNISRKPQYPQYGNELE
jgi:hypothetical protein